MTRKTLSSALMGATMVLVLAIAPAAHAAKLGGKKWPTRTITYHSAAPQYAEAIKKAVRAWNTSGVNVRFKPVSRRRAQLRIVHRGPGLAHGWATLGWAPRTAVTRREVDGAVIIGDVSCGQRVPGARGWSRVRCIRGPFMWLGKGTAQEIAEARTINPSMLHQMAVTVAHELGHVLGLQHVRGCALMHPNAPAGCRRPPDPQIRCRLLEADDVRGAIRRYGGRMRPLATEFCEPRIPAPRGVSLRFDPATRAVAVQRPAQQTLSVSGLVAQQNSCPSQSEEPRWDPGANADNETIDMSSRSGRFCVAIWFSNWAGQRSPPVMRWVDIPPPPVSEEPAGCQPRDPCSTRGEEPEE